MTSRCLKVLIVDDSPVALTVLSRILREAPDIEVIGTARDGKEGLARVLELKPDVLCADYHMPVMDGLEFTRQVMDQQPTPILCISTSVRDEDKDTVFKLLEAGAVDVFPKPEGGLNSLSAPAREELIRKVRLLSGVRVFRRRLDSASTGNATQRLQLAVTAAREQRAQMNGAVGTSARVVAIGASPGGPQALQEVLGALPAAFPVPILCVQHISLGFLSGLVRWLDDHSPLTIKVVRPGEQPVPGTVYFPQENTHLEVQPSGCLASTRKPPFGGLRPAVHVTFHSVAEHYGAAAVGVLLTGMGDDGAEGLLAISKAGGTTIVQDEASSTVFGMPRRAIELGAAKHVLPLSALAARLTQLRYAGS